MDRILRKPDIEATTSFTERRLRELEAAGCFPRRFLINPNGRSVGWLESEVQKWLETRAASRDK